MFNFTTKNIDYDDIFTTSFELLLLPTTNQQILENFETTPELHISTNFTDFETTENAIFETIPETTTNHQFPSSCENINYVSFVLLTFIYLLINC